MPKDPKRNLQRYQIQGGHLNEFEFQKSQGAMTEESELPFNNETEKPDLTQASRRIAEVTAEAHGIVEERKKRGLVKAAGRKSNGVGKRSATKSAKRSATKASKSAKTATSRTGAKKRAGKKRPQKRATR